MLWCFSIETFLPFRISTKVFSLRRTVSTDEASEIRTNKSGWWIRWFNDEDFGYWNDRWLWDIESWCNNTMTDIPLSFDFSIRLSCQSVLSSRRSMATVVYLRFGQPFNFSNGNAKRVANVLMATCRKWMQVCWRIVQLLMRILYSLDQTPSFFSIFFNFHPPRIDAQFH